MSTRGDLATLLPARLAEIRERIRAAGADPATVRIVAVTKGFGSEVVRAAHQAGLVEFGENYAHELLQKVPSAPPGMSWHFLGAVQSNKVRLLAPHVATWESVGSLHDVGVLSQRCPGAHVLVQMNLSPGEGRRGVPGEAVAGIVGAAREAGLDVRGLMAVGPRRADSAALREGFARVATVAAGLGLGELSMGMSGDFPLAVAEGATIIRLGRALFGDRSGTERGQQTQVAEAGSPCGTDATLGL